MERKAFFAGFMLLLLGYSIETHSYWVCNCQSNANARSDRDSTREVVTGKTKAQTLAQCFPTIVLANIDCYEYIPAPTVFSCGKRNEYVPNEEDCCPGLLAVQVESSQFFCQDAN